MKRLSPPTIDPQEIYTEVLERSRSQDKKERLDRLSEYVFDRYTKYEELLPDLQGISDSEITNIEDKNALESCYNRNEKGYLEGFVVSKIISQQTVQHKNSCPYCGIDKPRTIDHYLPKSIYPEFSIFPPNLIPCCGYCNSKKKDRWQKNGERLFINLYYDDIPNDKFLFAEFHFSENKINPVPTISYQINLEGINGNIKVILANHYKELKLTDEYSLSVEEEISNIYDEIKHNTHKSIEFHKSNIKIRLDTFVRKYGVNYWKSALLEALLDCDEFFERIYKY